MPKIKLVALRALDLGHRIIAQGETFAVVEFANEADAKFFRARLNWSAFAHEAVVDAEPAPTPAAAEGDAIEDDGAAQASKAVGSKAKRKG